jgi:PTH1 family peptidyl-tRNA hydrolase
MTDHHGMLAPNAPIRLVAGLGNPGAEYQRTRHNVGFWFVDQLAQRVGAVLRSEKKFFGEVGRVDGSIWLAKPMTFMNRSGQAVAALAGFYQLKPEEILVVHDELDLRPGEVKLKMGGGVAGHNGLKDIRARLGSADFWRLRIGIGHPREQELSEQDVVDYVLHRPSVEHQRLIEGVVEKCLDAWQLFERGEMERAMHQLHTKSKPPRSVEPPGAPTSKSPLQDAPGLPKAGDPGTKKADQA